MPGPEHPTVGCSHQDHAFVGFETIHLDKELVERLFAFIVTAAKTGTTMAAHSVDFIDEDDARCVLFALFEHVTHTRCTDTNEHFNEVRTRNGEERNVCFASNRTRQKGFTGTRRTDKQHAFGDFTAKALELLRIAQEVDDFFKLALGFFDAGNIFEGHAAGLLGQHFGLGLAKAHGLAAAALHLTHEEDPDTDDQKHREPADQSAHQRRQAFFRLCDDAHALVVQLFNEVRIIRGIYINRATVARFCSQVIALDGDFGNLA